MGSSFNRNVLQKQSMFLTLIRDVVMDTVEGVMPNLDVKVEIPPWTVMDTVCRFYYTKNNVKFLM